MGYQQSETASSRARVDALGQRVRDRFNEDPVNEYTSSQKSAGGQPASLLCVIILLVASLFALGPVLLVAFTIAISSS